VIWEPFVLALVLGLIISAGLYFAYLWPSVEPTEPTEPTEPSNGADPERPDAPAASSTSGPADPHAASPAP
jgi:hypothetical protein